MASTSVAELERIIALVEEQLVALRRDTTLSIEVRRLRFNSLTDQLRTLEAQLQRQREEQQSVSLRVASTSMTPERALGRFNHVA